MIIKIIAHLCSLIHSVEYSHSFFQKVCILLLYLKHHIIHVCLSVWFSVKIIVCCVYVCAYHSHCHCKLSIAKCHIGFIFSYRIGTKSSPQTSALRRSGHRRKGPLISGRSFTSFQQYIVAPMRVFC